MKVLQIANDYLSTALYVLLFNALSDRGIMNVIYVPVRDGEVYRKENDGIRTGDSSTLVISNCFNTIDRLTFYGKQKKVYRGIEKTVDFNSIDCVHAHTLFSSGYTARKIKECYGIPYIVAVRNTDVNLFFKRIKFLREEGIRILQEAEKVVFISPSYKNEVLEKYIPDAIKCEIAAKSIVIPNGVEKRFLLNKPTERELKNGIINILYAGEINRNKNLIETINACKCLINKGYICKYTVVGDITDRKYKKLLEEEFITYNPRCSHSELINYYKSNDLFVMPSHFETFGLVYVEAMSQGLPVIYTRGQGFDGYFEEGEVGFSVSDKDPIELADKIEKIINNRDLYKRISKNCIEKSGRFDWSMIGEEYKGIYEQAISNKVRVF